MQREHLDRQAGGRLDRPGHGVGNIVQLEVEEYTETHAGDLPHAVGPAGGEHLEANLGPPDAAAETGQDRGDFARGRGVEDEN